MLKKKALLKEKKKGKKRKGSDPFDFALILFTINIVQSGSKV